MAENSCLSSTEREQLDRIAAGILRLQRMGGLTTGEETTLAHSGTSEGCCFSGLSTGGCHPQTTTEPKITAPTTPTTPAG